MNDINKVHSSILQKQLQLESTLALIAKLILQDKNEPSLSSKLTIHERKILKQVADKLQGKTFPVPSTSPKLRRQSLLYNTSKPISESTSTALTSPVKPLARRQADKTSKPNRFSYHRSKSFDSHS